MFIALPLSAETCDRVNTYLSIATNPAQDEEIRSYLIAELALTREQANLVVSYLPEFRTHIVFEFYAADASCGEAETTRRAYLDYLEETRFLGMSFDEWQASRVRT